MSCLPTENILHAHEDQGASKLPYPENNSQTTSSDTNEFENYWHPLQCLPCQKNPLLKKTCETTCSFLVDSSLAFEFLNLGLSNFHEVNLRNATLEQALTFLDCPDLLKNMDQNLELVQKQLIRKEDHEIYFNQHVNDKFRRFSIRYHPDRIKNRGGSEDDVNKTTEIQKIVNSVWGILKMLHSNFIDSNYLSDQNFHYGTCSMVEISILSNEERLKSLNNKILIELCWLARIKHEKMINNINKFLKLGKSCMQSFIQENDSGFQQKRKRALIYFNLFYSGYQELSYALKKLMEDCEKDTDLACIKSSVQRMFTESRENLKKLQLTKQHCLHQGFKNFPRHIYENADRNFVLPFMVYLDLLSKCEGVNEKRMRKKESKSKIGKIWMRICERFHTVIRCKMYDYEDSDINRHIDISSCNGEEIIFPVKTDDPGKLYHLFYHLVMYYCLGDESITEILNRNSNMHIDINEEVAYSMLIEILKKYAQHIENEFQLPQKVSESDLREFKNDIERSLSEFTTSMRKTAQVGLEEIKKEQNRIKEEFAQMEAKFDAEVQDTVNENTEKFKEMEEKLRQENEIRKQVEETLINESRSRAELEEEIKVKMKLNAHTQEQKLREQSQNVEREIESRISKKIEKIMNMKAELEEILEYEERQLGK